MESTAADAMPDNTDLTPQAPEPEPEQAPAQSSSGPPFETNSNPTAAEANPVMELALNDLQERRDALKAEIAGLTSRKEQLETCLLYTS